MNDNEKWQILQKEAERKAKEQLLEALLKATLLDEYIAKEISSHEQTMHGE